MRFKFLALVLLGSSLAGAQGRVYPERRHYIVLGDAIGTAAGGFLSGTTILQAMRLSAVATLYGSHGVDVSAMRLQTLFPPGGRVNDLEFSNPKSDALILSYANLNRTRARGFPNQSSIGFGVARRQTSEPGRTRDTWIARVGYDADPFKRWSHLDTGVGINIFVMPATQKDVVYIAAIGLYIRTG
jgi:hypothetical protein